MITHWILRVGDGNNFRASSSRGIWGVKSKNKNGKPMNRKFITHAKPGDVLWFVQNGCGSKIIAVATLTSLEERVLGPILALTPTNEELGWTGDGAVSDIQVNYTTLYDLSECELNSGITGQASIRQYKPEKCNINLPHEYKHIARYRRPVSSL
jgi:hypothetical protein